MSTSPPCAFCGHHSTLRQSHVLPRWIIQRALTKSPTGRMRDSDAINRPVQDGEKLPLLCDSCENMFCALESEQAHKYDHGEIKPGATYDQNFCKFVVSVLWRVGVSRLEQVRTDYPHFEVALNSALQTWKNFLDGNCQVLGDHAVYFLFLDANTANKVFTYQEEGRSDVRPSPVLHRYMLNSINTELAIYDQDGYVISWAMGNSWLMAGVVEVPRTEQVQSPIDILSAGGVFPTGQFDVPQIILATLQRQSWKYLEEQGQISSRQRSRIRELASARAGQFTDQSQLMAREADIKMFGDSANIELADRSIED